MKLCRFTSLALLIALLSLTHTAPDALAQERETRDVEAFTSVGFAIAGTLYISKGDAHTVEIDADDEILEYIETVVEDGRLHVRGTQDTGWFSWLRSTTRRNATADV